MGVQFCSTLSHPNMKALLLGALVTTVALAAAEPEAEANPGYGSLYYPYFYLGHGYVPLKPPSIANIDYGKTKISYKEKRSAEAEPETGIKREADPMDEGAGPAAWYAASNSYYYGGFYPY